MSAVENCVCFNLRWVTRAVTQFYDAEMRRHGIRPTQGTILASLQAKESWSMAELSDWLGMERTTLVRNLRPLQRDGFGIEQSQREHFFVQRHQRCRVGERLRQRRARSTVGVEDLRVAHLELRRELAGRYFARQA